MEDISIEFYEEVYSLINLDFKKKYPFLTLQIVVEIISTKIKTGFAPTKISKITKKGIKIRFTYMNSKRFKEESVGNSVEKFILDIIPNYKELSSEEKIQMYKNDLEEFSKEFNSKFKKLINNEVKGYKI